jgi:hypothetical protein
VKRFAGLTQTALDVGSLVRLAQEWSDLGWAVHEQVIALANGEAIEVQNPQAMRMFASWLRSAAAAGADDGGLADEILSALDGRPSDSRMAQRRLAALSEAERMAVVGEEGEATNAHKLDLTGTHYVDDAGIEVDWLWNI